MEKVILILICLLGCVYDEFGNFETNGNRVTTTSVISKITQSCIKYPGTRVLILHADQLSYRSLAMILEAIPIKTPGIFFLSLLSNPRKQYCEKGTPVLRYYCRNDKFLDGFAKEDWKRFQLGRPGPDALHVYNVLPYPDHKIRDIGTFMASALPNQPCPKISLVMPGYSLRKHFLQLYKAGIKYARKDFDILDLI